jgi:glycosyltransferase involved in cell wall biosynthesis
MELMSPENKSDQKTYRILVVDLEPTPYKTDLWNVFSDSKEIEIFVIYTERKNWSPDGGHNYLKWPTNRHGNTILEGKGIYGALRSALFVAQKIFGTKTDLICIAGYVHFPTVVALICSIILRKRFVMHADEFNNNRPGGKLSGLKLFFRELLRKLIFKYGKAVLVCGRRGVESALLAGCKEEKILDFPYVIDVERMRIEAPEVVPQGCVWDLDAGATIIFFSGRMIPRKGLPTLLAALSGKPLSKKWVLWIEGDGPELNRYKSLAQEYGIHDRCRFLGFCQYDVHSWLIRSADIVVVPSLVDSWGIIVDEGIQLGKAVISSDATGSGYDRILNEHNGFIFPAGNAVSLSNILNALIDDNDQRALIGGTAMSGDRNFRPADNLETLLKLIRIN